MWRVGLSSNVVAQVCLRKQWEIFLETISVKSENCLTGMYCWRIATVCAASSQRCQSAVIRNSLHNWGLFQKCRRCAWCPMQQADLYLTDKRSLHDHNLYSVCPIPCGDGQHFLPILLPHCNLTSNIQEENDLYRDSVEQAQSSTCDDIC